MSTPQAVPPGYADLAARNFLPPRIAAAILRGYIPTPAPIPQAPTTDRSRRYSARPGRPANEPRPPLPPEDVLYGYNRRHTEPYGI